MRNKSIVCNIYTHLHHTTPQTTFYIHYTHTLHDMTRIHIHSYLTPAACPVRGNPGRPSRRAARTASAPG